MADREGGWRPGADAAALRARARLSAGIRRFFADRDVLEVETPILSQHGTTDRFIESFCVHGTDDAARWLRTSPEFAHKRLLASGVGDCYELGRVFRRGEAGRRHNPEFTMLEWYRLGWTHRTLIGEVFDLIVEVATSFGRPVLRRTSSYADLFREGVGIDPHRATDAEVLAAVPAEVVDAETLERDDWLDLIFTLRLQPGFPADQLLAVVDYPASQCALARVRRDQDIEVAERFEVYWGGMELANGYHELTDAAEQRTRFLRDVAWRAEHGRPGPGMDAHLLEAMAHGLPACAGVAVGVDRWLACLLDRPLHGVIAFADGRA